MARLKVHYIYDRDHEKPLRREEIRKRKNPSIRSKESNEKITKKRTNLSLGLENL